MCERELNEKIESRMEADEERHHGGTGIQLIVLTDGHDPDLLCTIHIAGTGTH